MTRKKVNTILLLIIFVLLFGVSIGYSALSQVLNISGSTAYSHNVNASNLSYDNSSSGLSATTAQDAIDWLSGKYDNNGLNSDNTNTVYTLNLDGIEPKISFGQTIPNGVTEYSSPNQAMEAWGQNSIPSQNFYLRHTIDSEDGRVLESYVEYIVTSQDVVNNPGMVAGTYSLKGNFGGGSFYEDNLETIKESFGYDTNNSRCFIDNSYGMISCSVYGLSVDATSSGNVTANDEERTYAFCAVNPQGTAWCSS